jgi:hypothetical protein
MRPGQCGDNEQHDDSDNFQNSLQTVHTIAPHHSAAKVSDADPGRPDR